MERLTEKDSTGYKLVLKNSVECVSGDLKHWSISTSTTGMQTIRGYAVDKFAEYEDLEEQGKLLRLPCKVGDAVFIDSKTLPTDNMDFSEDEEIPLCFRARVVSFRKNCNGIFVKLAVRAEWLYERFDPECGEDIGFYDAEKYFTYPLSALNKTVFLTQEQAELALKEMEGE